MPIIDTFPVISLYFIISPTLKYSSDTIVNPLIISFRASCIDKPTIAEIIPTPASIELTLTPFTCNSIRTTTIIIIYLRELNVIPIIVLFLNALLFVFVCLAFFIK